MQRRTLKAPFAWVGGKSKLSQDIIDLIPAEHKLYVEVFNDSVVVRELYKGFNYKTYKRDIIYTWSKC